MPRQRLTPSERFKRRFKGMIRQNCCLYGETQKTFLARSWHLSEREYYYKMERPLERLSLGEFFMLAEGAGFTDDDITQLYREVRF